MQNGYKKLFRLVDGFHQTRDYRTWQGILSLFCFFLFSLSLTLAPSVFVGVIFLGTKNGSRSLATQKNKPLCVKIIFLATEIVAYLFLCSQLSAELDRR